MSISDVEREDGLVDEPTGSRRERPAESYQSTGVQKQRNTAWGFWLVLAALLAGTVRRLTRRHLPVDQGSFGPVERSKPAGIP